MIAGKGCPEAVVQELLRIRGPACEKQPSPFEERILPNLKTLAKTKKTGAQRGVKRPWSGSDTTDESSDSLSSDEDSERTAGPSVYMNGGLVPVHGFKEHVKLPMKDQDDENGAYFGIFCCYSAFAWRSLGVPSSSACFARRAVCILEELLSNFPASLLLGEYEAPAFGSLECECCGGVGGMMMDSPGRHRRDRTRVGPLRC
ncbi:hypothetical protein HPB52_006021 [Rhipicephalus sanguineus]|uniref:Uncharacterized protein n=1 Tax=Rhipicephalus sanguineus TaxID=34632 RepID=A0A9D4SXW7_RHISA|nr:hypothetical protein HPB52_006021 [Rhipicephalus sanguineus]